MSAGRFTRMLEVLVAAGPDDGQGGQEDTWTPLRTVWAEVVPAGGWQRLSAGLLQTEVTHRIATWFDAALLTERRALRARELGGPLYAIRVVRDPDGRRITLECDAVQVSEEVPV